MRLVAVAACCVVAGAAFAADFKAGFSKVDITPRLGVSMSGYYRYREADGVLDNLHARCVAMSDCEKTALVFSIDNLHIGDPVVKKVKDRITGKTGVPGDAIFLACTHTHTGPSWYVSASKGPEAVKLTAEANEMMADRCAEAAAKAIADMVPSRIFIGRGEATDISFVRRFRMKDGSYRTNPNRNDPNVVAPAGEPDNMLQLVRFVRKGAKDIALVNFQCHPDVIGGTKISADWPGLSSTYLENAFAGGICAIFINGAQGDTNHLRQRWKAGEPLPRRYDMAHHMARTVAGSAMKVWGFCREVPAGKVNATVRMVKVKVNKADPSEYPLAEKWHQFHISGKSDQIPDGSGMLRTVNTAWACRVVATRKWPDEKEMPVTVVTVGQSLALGGFAGEPFTQMGRDVKRRSKFAMTIPACCTGGSFGYFPMKDAFTVGGYENATSRYAKGTAEALVDGMVAQMNAFYDAAADK